VGFPSLVKQGVKLAKEGKVEEAISQKTSIGDKILVPTLTNPDKQAGVEAIAIRKYNLSRFKLIPNLAPDLAMILSLYLIIPVIELGDRLLKTPWYRSAISCPKLLVRKCDRLLKTLGTEVRSSSKNSWLQKCDRLLKTLSTEVRSPPFIQVEMTNKG
jgi:hypothetical protein